jgi:hypothetical protein
MRDVGPTERALTPGVPATPGGARGAAPAGSPVQQPQPTEQTPAVQLAPSLARWLRGGVIEAVVVGHGGAGQAVVQTAPKALGANFTLTGGPPLEVNAKLLLQLFASGAELKAAIVEIDGQKLQPPPEVALTPAPPSAARQAPRPAAPQSAAPHSPAPQSPNATPSPLGGMASPVASLPERAADNPRPNQVSGTPIAAQRPTAGAAVAKPFAIGTPLTAIVVAPPANSAINVSATGLFSPVRATAFPVGATLVLTPRSIELPALETPGLETPTARGATPALGARTPTVQLGAAQPGAAALGGGGPNAVLHGVVAPPPHQGIGRQTLVHTAQGTLRLETSSPIATGAHLTVEVIEVRLPPAPELAGEAPIAQSLSRLSRDWRVLWESLQAAAAADPAVANRVLQQILPKPGPRLASTLLLFLGALPSGDPDAWLGADFSAALENAGRKDLPHRLGEEFRQLAQAQQQENGDWRLFVLPLLGAHEIHPIHLFVRRRRRREAEEKDADVRFIVDLELQSIGTLQLDGLVRPAHFDLILRSRHALPQHWRRDIAAIFDDALAVSGLKGQMAFQARTPEPLEPAPPTTARAGVTV